MLPVASTPALPAVANPITQRVACGDQVVRVSVARFPASAGPAVLVAEERRLLGYTAGTEASLSWLKQPNGSRPIWRLSEAEEPARTGVTALWIDGEPAQIGLRMRIRLALRSLRLGGSTPLLVAVLPDNDRSEQGQAGKLEARNAIEAFLRSQPDLIANLARLSQAPAL